MYVIKDGLNLPSDEQISAVAAAAGFTVGAKVHVRNAPAYTAAPIREFSWADGLVVAVWMGGACRTPLQDLVLLPLEPAVLAEMEYILNSWTKDLSQAVQENGCESELNHSRDWVPEYAAECGAEQTAPLADEEGYSITPQADDEDNQDSTEYPEDPADEQRG